MTARRAAAGLLVTLCSCTFDPAATGSAKDSGTLPGDPRDAGGIPPDGGAVDAGDTRDGSVASDAGPRDGGPARDAGDMRDGGDVRDGGRVRPDGGPSDCGNRRIDAPEECDDGNQTPADGCNNRCRVEPGWTCVGEPSICRQNTDIVFVDGTNQNCPGSGSDLDPFCDLASGFDADSPVVIVRAGAYTQDQTISTQVVEIIGDGVVTLAPVGDKLFVISGASDVTFRNLRLTGSTNDIIDIGGSSIARVIDSELGPALGHGVHMKASSRLELDRTIVHDIGDKPLILDGAGGFSIVSSIVANNGAVGLEVSQIDPTSIVLNSTIVGNAGEGIICGVSVPVLNSIVWGNNGVSTASSGCQERYSVLQMVSTSTTNVTADPLLDNTFHLMAGSPAIDRGDPAGVPPAPALDIDHDLRPQGGRVDIGADER